MDQLFEDAQGQVGFELTVDLEAGVITGGSAGDIAFSVDSFRRHCLLHGLDDIGLTLEKTSQIKQLRTKASTAGALVVCLTRTQGFKYPIKQHRDNAAEIMT